jgi:hypothetical protein
MKYFGEFLVEKKIISIDSLVDALLDQTKNTPATGAIIRSQKLLSTEQILEVFKYQTKNGIEFREACNILGLWNATLTELIRKEISARRTPLGEVLIMNGALSLPLLTQAVDEFLSDDTNIQPVLGS